MDAPDGPARYPVEWEADVVLANGRPVHLRPIRPSDEAGLRAFHQRLSPQAVYYRFFAAKPELTDEEVAYFSNVDYRDRVALVAIVGEATAGAVIVGVGRFDRVGPTDAEVAFSIQDDFQGRGLGSALLEHLAAAARERGISRFTAEVLPTNRRMLSTFRAAGYQVQQRLDDDVVAVAFDIEPTQQSRAVVSAREHRAEARSIERLLTAGSIAVVGASRRPGSIGHALLRNLVQAGFGGSVIAVHPDASQILGVPCVPRLRDARDRVDLALVAVPADAVAGVVQDAAAAGVVAMVVVSGGFGDTGPEGMARQRSLVAAARSLGIRVVGPNALGLMNTDPAVRMNASLVSVLPERGGIGFFSQSGALGSSILDRVRMRGLGISTFVSAGNRADVSGNDVLQYWEEDQATDVVMLYLETLGNPRKFARLVRRIAISKPVLMVRTGVAAGSLPSGHVTPVSSLPQFAVDDLLAAAGLVSLSGIDQMLDVAGVLSCQPMPPVPGLAIVGNSDALAVLATNAAERVGCSISASPVTFARDSSPLRYRSELGQALADPSTGVALVIHVPPVESSEDASVLDSIAEVGASAGKPVVAVMQGHGPASVVASGIPVFADVEAAISAIASMQGLARWRRELAEDPHPPPDVDPDEFGCVAQAVVKAMPAGSRAAHRVAGGELMAAAGLAVAPPTGSPDPAVRVELRCDRLFGPLVSVCLDDQVAMVLRDASFRLAPMHPRQAQDAVRSLRALVPVLDEAGLDSARLVDSYADVVHRVSWMNEWDPSIQRVVISQLRWKGQGWTGLVEIQVDPAGEVFDPQVRRMGG